MARIFNFKRFSKGESESTLSESTGSTSLSSGESCEERRKKIDKRVSKFLQTCIGNSSSGTDADVSSDANGRHSTPAPPVADREEKQQRTKVTNILYYVKITVLVLIWLSFTASLMIWSEKEEVVLHTHVVPLVTKNYLINHTRADLRIQLKVTGPFAQAATVNATAEPRDPQLELWLDRWIVADPGEIVASAGSVRQSSDVIKLDLLPDESIDFAIASTKTQVLNLPAMTNASDYLDELESTNSSQVFVIRMRSNSSRILSLVISYSEYILEVKDGVIYALVLLIVLYTLIIFEVVNRMFAAMITSTMGIAVLAAVGERLSMEQVVSWIDVEMLLLLFSMMLLVAILAETGLFDYLAVMAFKWTNGQIWPLILSLCLITAVLSTFLDNVTTVLLMTPVTIRLCEVMELNPVPVLMATVIYSNVGGTATPVGDPPNVIIVSNRAIINAGIDFTTFTMHMSAGIVLVCVQTYIQLRWSYRDINKLRHSVPPEIQCLKQELAVWRRAAASLASYSADEALVRVALERQVTRLQRQLKKKKLAPPPPVPRESYTNTLREMEQKYPIRDKALLIKATIALSFVVIVFFLHSLPELKRLSLGWTALLGAILLLILADRADLEPIIARVEWSTLLFFAALFILMEALSKLGLISFIGDLTEHMIMQVEVKYRLMVAILLLLWGRYAVAATEIKTGSTLAVDAPYAACLLPEFAGTHCAECFKRLRAPVWCPTCAAVAFCSVKCKERALSSYHKYECKFFDLFIGSGMSILSHIALRMLTQIGLQASLSIHAKYLCGQNKGIDADEVHENTFEKLDNVDKMPKVKSRKAKLGRGRKGNKLEGSPKSEKKMFQDDKAVEKNTSNGVRWDFDSMTQHIYSLCTHSDRRNAKDYLHRVLMALFLTKCLKEANFFEKNKDNDTLSPDEIAVAELVLRNLQLLQFNAHELYETVRSASHKFTGAKACYIAVAIYPTGALFNHECYPAVGRYFHGKNIILKSLRPLKPNETIAENYGPQFLIKPKAERQRSLASRYWFKCECQACLGNWPQLKEMTSGEIPSFKCPNEQCQKPLKCTIKDNDKTWNEQCKSCTHPISQREMHEKCKMLTSRCIAEYERAAALMEAEKSQDAMGALCEAIDIFHELSLPPHKETHIAQEALRSCFADFGNVNVVT